MIANPVRISAADNLVVEASPSTWQLRVNTNFVELQGEGLLLEARDADPVLRYTSAFAVTRRLPRSGQLSTRYIQRVVLGWSAADEAWHLGLMLEAPLAQVRGSRWCELVKWPDPESEVFKAQAIDAGRTLARLLERPFNLVDGVVTTISSPVEAVPLPLPPLMLQGWAFDLRDNGWLVIERLPGWVAERWRRVAWFALWSVVFTILSVGVLTAGISRPRPEFLPYVGFGVAVMLVGLVIFSLWELFNRPRKIIIDPSTHQAWGVVQEGSGSKAVWRMPREAIDAVYVTQVIRNKRTSPHLHYAEINLRATDGRFHHLCNLTESEPLTGEPARPEEISPLNRRNVQTRVQVVGVYLSEALNVPAWYDYRG
jgi:hypothetical protein